MYLKKYLSPTKETIAWLTLINSFLKVDVLNVINPKNVVKHIKVDEKAHYHTDVEKKCSMAQTRRPVLASHYIVNKINSNSGIFFYPVHAFMPFYKCRIWKNFCALHITVLGRAALSESYSAKMSEILRRKAYKCLASFCLGILDQLNCRVTLNYDLK